MKNFDTRVYSVSDFVEWESRGQIQLSPDFQRRSVWSLQAKSYLVDTVIRGKPMPKLLITQDVRDRRNNRIVVDGQQRLRAILEFVNGDFPVSRAHNKEYASRRFDDLPEDVRTDFLKYEVGVDLLYDLPYRDILDIFARLNTYTVKLNKQELLNAKYVGYFKQLSYKLGYRYVDYLIAAKVVTKAQVTRMVEAELTSDLMVALADGIQSSKSIETYYKKYEEIFDGVDSLENKFDQTMGILSSIYAAEDLANTNWSRIHLFYSLFVSLAHGVHPVAGLDPNVRPMVGVAQVQRVRVALDDISARFDAYTSGDDGLRPPADFALFIDRSRRATTDTGARIDRSKFICDKLVAAIAA
ncbi:DUF262 domain-containing protein [Devosia sp. D6-9]|nr:DUF262 domain-containing protein [Devosia sp. D6-9]